MILDSIIKLATLILLPKLNKKLSLKIFNLKMKFQLACDFDKATSDKTSYAFDTNALY